MVARLGTLPNNPKSTSWGAPSCCTVCRAEKPCPCKIVLASPKRVTTQLPSPGDQCTGSDSLKAGGVLGAGVGEPQRGNRLLHHDLVSY